jgi:hypothetical protein
VDKLVEEHLAIHRNHPGGGDGWYSLRRVHEFSLALNLTEEKGRYAEYSQRVQSSGGAGL